MQFAPTAANNIASNNETIYVTAYHAMQSVTLYRTLYNHSC